MERWLELQMRVTEQPGYAVAITHAARLVRNARGTVTDV